MSLWPAISRYLNKSLPASFYTSIRSDKNRRGAFDTRLRRFIYQTVQRISQFQRYPLPGVFLSNKDRIISIRLKNVVQQPLFHECDKFQ